MHLVIPTRIHWQNGLENNIRVTDMSARALKIGIFVTGFMIVLLTTYKQEACSMEPRYILVKVKDINGEIIQLSDMQKIRLAGIKIPDNYKSEAGEYIKSITKDCRVFAVPAKPNKQNTEGVVEAFLFLWGSKQIDLSKLSPVEKKGFGNIKAGLFDVRKGVGVNLNALLVRRGYSIVDDGADIPSKSEFLSLQKMAQDEGAGLWKTSGADR